MANRMVVLRLGLFLVLGFLMPACGDDDSSKEDTSADMVDDVGDQVEDTSVDTGGTDTHVADSDQDSAVDTSGDTGNDTATGCTSDSECAAGEACHQVTGECVANTRCLAEGSDCDAAVNHPRAFLCADDGSGNTVCTATCDEPADCGSGEFCGASAEAPERFVCKAEDCNGPFDTTSCGTGERCYAMYFGDPPAFSGAFGCGPIDVEGSRGDACTGANQCADGLICYRDFCLDMCAPTAGTACPAGSACVTDETLAQADLGACVPYDCDPTASGQCASGMTCAPTVIDVIDDTLVGDCLPAGTGAVGVACTVVTDCAEDLFCLDSVCSAVTVCSTETGNPGFGACPTDAFCVTLENMGNYGVCSEPYECELFSSTTGCGSTDRCFPDLGDNRNGAGLAVGLCGPSVTAGAPGAACNDWNECGDGLGCLDSICRALCDYNTATTGQGACPSGEACAAVFGDVTLGVCVPAECDPLGTGGCASGEMCQLLAVVDPDVFGQCVAAGTVVEGGTCTGWAQGECAPGNVCLDDGAGAWSCFELCDPQTNDACGANRLCRPFFDEEDAPVVSAGFCLDACTPYVTDTGCAAGETCLPDQEDASFGNCWPAGTKGPGETCSTLTQCALGLVCAGTCQEFCDPDAASGATGSCSSADEACVRYVSMAGDRISFGGCKPGCTAGDPADQCADGFACIAGPLATGGASADFCEKLVPATTCSASSQGQLCDDALAACLDIPSITDGLECLELCMESHGAFLRVGHPDCSAPDAICDPSRLAGIGFCNAAD